MEGDPKRRECRPKRRYQCSRMEDQLWELAYQQLWPIVRRGIERRMVDAQRGQLVDSQTITKGA